MYNKLLTRKEKKILHNRQKLQVTTMHVKNSALCNKQEAHHHCVSDDEIQLRIDTIGVSCHLQLIWG